MSNRFCNVCIETRFDEVKPPLIQSKIIIVKLELTMPHEDVTVLIFFLLCEINTKLQLQHDESSNYLQGNMEFAY